MARKKELEFMIPEIMEECDSETLKHMIKRLPSVVIDYERQRVKVTVSSRNANNVIRRVSKSNFKLSGE